MSQRWNWKRALVRILIALLIGVFAFFFLLAFFVEKILFQPPPQNPFPKAKMLDTGGESIAVYFLPASAPKNGRVVLYSHGNAEDLSTVSFLLEEYQKAGYDVIGYDYEGYGASGGKPSVRKTYRDITAVYRYLTEVKKFPPETIVVIGFSIGTGPSCYLAEKFPVGALVLEAPFASAYQVILPFGGIPGDPFPNAERMKRIKTPVLVIHGEQDCVIPIRNGRTVYARAVSPKIFHAVPNAGHNDLKEVLGTRYWNILDEFLNSSFR